MSLPEVLPILTSSRVTFELRATSLTEAAWFAVAKPTQRLCAVVSPIDFIAMRDEVRSITDPVVQCYRMAELARLETFHAGAPIGAIEKIPEGHHMGIVAKIAALSTAGFDPFFEAPAESSP